MTQVSNCACNTRLLQLLIMVTSEPSSLSTMRATDVILLPDLTTVSILCLQNCNVTQHFVVYILLVVLAVPLIDGAMS